MTQRFDGAITTPGDEIPDQFVVPEPERPERPVLVELASAILIVIVLYLTAFPHPIAMFYVALDTVVLYALIHHRAWFDWKASADSGAL